MSRDFAVVFRGPIVEAEIVRSVLEQVGIRAVVDKEQIAIEVPWVADPGGVQPARVIVNAEDEDAARAEIERAREP